MFPYRRILVSFLLSLLVVSNVYADRGIKIHNFKNKYALVIGNGNYKTSPLKNPVNDANDIANSLTKLGFETEIHINADQKEIRKAIRKFGNKIKKGGVGLFYFAGHGMQVKGRNYLIPVGTDIQEEDEVQDYAVDAGMVLRKMQTAGNPLNIVILDACRNNPFSRSFRSGQKGLAQMDAPQGSLIVYATAPGSVAADGKGRNGIFTKNLLKYINEPNIEIGMLLRKVRSGVLDDTNQKQIPWESSSLTGEFYFIKTEKEHNNNSKPQKSETYKVAHEDLYWRGISNSNNVKNFRKYLTIYPNGKFVSIANQKIKQLTPAKKEYQTTEIDDFKIELIECKLYNRKVNCKVRVTNLGEDRSIKLDAKDSILYDSLGNKYHGKYGKLANVRSEYPELMLINNVPVEMSIDFGAIPVKGRIMAGLHLRIYLRNAYRAKNPKFSKFPMEGGIDIISNKLKILQTTELDDFKIDLIECKLSNRKINCKIRVTNLGEDRSIKLDAKDSIFYDSLGNKFHGKYGKLANVQSEYPELMLINNVPVEMNVDFGTIPVKGKIMAGLHLRMYLRNAYRAKFPIFSKFPMEGGIDIILKKLNILQTTELDDFKIDLIECKLSNRKINCKIRVTNLGEDRSIKLDAKDSILYDSLGNKYHGKYGKLANVRSEYPELMLINNVPVEMNIDFGTIPIKGKIMAGLHLRMYLRNAYRAKYPKFSKFEIF